MTLLEQALGQTVVVVPSIEGAALLERLLPSIDLPMEQVVVVEQGSADGSEALCLRMGTHVLQLGHQATFTQAVNAGIRWAMDRGFKYICVCNNDVRFATQVVHQLLETLLNNRRVGIVAPTQVMLIDDQVAWVGYRATWDLAKMRFRHQVDHESDGRRDREADFCEFTCALVPADVFADVGLLDDAFGFYHEDADFGLRLLINGYRALYNQQAQILHWGSSTVSLRLGERRKRHWQRRNQMRLRAKFLGHGTNLLLDAEQDAPRSPEQAYARELDRILRATGLLQLEQPAMGTGDGKRMAGPYQLAAIKSAHLQASWLAQLRDAEHVFVPTVWGQEILLAAGCRDVHVLPAGIDPDVFHPQGPAWLSDAGKRFLVHVSPTGSAGVGAALHAWRAIRDQMPDASLVIYGHAPFPERFRLDSPATSFIHGNIRRDWHAAERIWVLQPLRLLPASDLAAIYRSGHALIYAYPDEGMPIPVLEAMACGIVCVVGRHGLTEAPAQSGHCLVAETDEAVGARAVSGAGSRATLQARWLEAYSLGAEEYASRVQSGLQWVLTEGTLRNTARVLYGYLAQFQIAPKRQPAATESMATWGRFEHRYLRGLLADGLIRLGGTMERAGRMLRGRGLAAVLKRSAVEAREQLARRFVR